MKPALRHRSRILLVQALYEKHIADNPVDEIIEQTLINHDPIKYDLDYFKELFVAIIENIPQIDSLILPNLKDLYSIDEVTAIELSVLRLSIYELLYRLDIPYKVIINEAIEVTKKFGTPEGYKFVNGLLNKLASELRQTELMHTAC